MSTYVLVHGAGHDGSHWSQIAKLLEQQGHTTHAPSVGGHGPGADLSISHAQCTAAVVDYIEKHDVKDFVLVGHSFGGTIICKVVEAVPERVRRLVYWNAFVPEDGNSLNDETPPHYRQLFEQMAADSTDGGIMLPYNIWREAFINDGDEAMASSTYATLFPSPKRAFFDKLDLKKFYSLADIPRSYINFTEDTALPHGEWCWHPRMSSRLGFVPLGTTAGKPRGDLH